MFLSINQLEQSSGRLEWVNPFFGIVFLAFKMAALPIGRTTQVNFSQAVNAILAKHFKPDAEYAGFYSPLLTSHPKDRWVTPRFASTSLQRVAKNTFEDALIHPPKSMEWGWRPGYVKKLAEKLTSTKNGLDTPVRKLPAFDLSVWLFHGQPWPRATESNPRLIVNYFKDIFHITTEEADALFDLEIPDLAKPWLAQKPIPKKQLLDLLGRPPGLFQEEGAALRSLKLRWLGPAKSFDYQPASRLNIITGDNSLGKTFILDCIWWALTGSWLETPISPRADTPKPTDPVIEFSVGVEQRAPQQYTCTYDWKRLSWDAPAKRHATPALVIYARADGGFAVLDPARRIPDDRGHVMETGPVFFRDRRSVRDPLVTSNGLVLCNGLLADWVSWQTGGDRYGVQFDALTSCLKALSPPDGADSWSELRPGMPRRVPFQSRETPTILMPYGEVAITEASAGVQRIISLAYVLVWAWTEHLTNSALTRSNPKSQIVLLIDEVESHLHPRWQRVIVQSIISAIDGLAASASAQIHLTTHSPLVMASVEEIFSEKIDDLHHLKLASGAGDVVLEELLFVKQGTVNRWLTGEVFALGSPRSPAGELAIKDAKALQRREAPVLSEAVREVDKRLRRFLASDDDFWPRWRYFAEQHEAVE